MEQKPLLLTQYRHSTMERMKAFGDLLGVYILYDVDTGRISIEGPNRSNVPKAGKGFYSAKDCFISPICFKDGRDERSNYRFEIVKSRDSTGAQKISGYIKGDEITIPNEETKG